MNEKQHLVQVRHNKKFLAYLENNSSGQFLDWQITVVFYTALHLIHALASKKKKPIGTEHKKVNISIDPQNADSILPLPQDVYEAYICLYQNSRNARYKCWIDTTLPKLLDAALTESKNSLREIENHCKAEGIKV